MGPAPLLSESELSHLERTVENPVKHHSGEDNPHDLTSPDQLGITAGEGGWGVLRSIAVVEYTSVTAEFGPTVSWSTIPPDPLFPGPSPPFKIVQQADLGDHRPVTAASETVQINDNRGGEHFLYRGH